MAKHKQVDVRVKNKQVLALIGKNLRQARITKEMTQTHVAGELCVSKQLVSAWEAGRSEILSTTLLEYSELLGVTPNDLLRVRERANLIPQISSSRNIARPRSHVVGRRSERIVRRSSR